MPRSDSPQKYPRFVMLASVCVIVAALYFARDVLVPVALAVMLSFILGPLVMRLERKGLPRTFAVVLLVSVVFTVLGGLTYTIFDQVEQLAEQLPQYQDNIISKVRDFRGHASAPFTRAADALERVTEVATEPTSQPTTNVATASENSALPKHASTTQPVAVSVVPPPTSPIDVLRNNLGNVLGPLGTAGIVLVFVIFMLLGREDLRDRIIRLVGEGQIQLTTQALDDAGTRISRYLVAQFIINGTYGVAVATGLCIIGFTLGNGWFPSFVLWGFLCMLLRFIPYVGPWIGAAFPLTLAFAVYDGYSVFFAVAGMLAVLELITNTVMEPWLYGAKTGISTLAILVAAVFWTWLWGAAGLLLSTPLTVCLVVFGKYVPHLGFLDILLGDQPVLEPHERLYQRLLAVDNGEASELAEDYFKDHSLEELYDKMFLPALMLAEQDRHFGRLDEGRSTILHQTLREMIDEFADDERLRQSRGDAADTVAAARDEAPANGEAKSEAKPAPRPKISGDCVVNVICIPAHDEADELAGLMLSHLLELLGFCAVNISENALASEMLGEVEKRHAQVVCISALPPAAITHARYLCKRLYGRFHKMPVLVGLWTVNVDQKKTRQRLGCDPNAGLATTLGEALDQMQKISEPLLVQGREDASRERAAELIPSSPPRRP